MESRGFYTFTFALLFICLHARADVIGSVFFLDSLSHQYIRPRSSESEHQMDLMSLSEVGAAVSVLLGFAPSASLSADSSSKLNEVLVPNPFNRPRAVFLLEVKGAEGSQHVVGSGSDSFSNAFRNRVLYDKSEVNIHVPDQDELSVVSLTESSSFNSNIEFSDKELNNFAFLLGGSYVADALKPLTGDLTIPLKNGVQLKLHMSEKADKTFITSLLSLFRNVQREIDLHQDLSGSMQKPAELMAGSFNGIKALQEKYGTDGAQQGVELFVALLSKIFDSLQTAHKGKIVGVIFLKESPSSESDHILDVKITSRPSPRLLEEQKAKSSIHTAEVLLVRRTLAWLTGFILLISTLLGIYYLLYMPITRDTLLYSNVKLD